MNIHEMLESRITSIHTMGRQELFFCVKSITIELWAYGTGKFRMKCHI